MPIYSPYASTYDPDGQPIKGVCCTLEPRYTLTPGGYVPTKQVVQVQTTPTGYQLRIGSEVLTFEAVTLCGPVVGRTVTLPHIGDLVVNDPKAPDKIAYTVTATNGFKRVANGWQLQGTDLGLFFDDWYKIFGEAQCTMTDNEVSVTLNNVAPGATLNLDPLVQQFATAATSIEVTGAATWADARLGNGSKLVSANDVTIGQGEPATYTLTRAFLKFVIPSNLVNTPQSVVGLLFPTSPSMPLLSGHLLTCGDWTGLGGNAFNMDATYIGLINPQPVGPTFATGLLTPSSTDIFLSLRAPNDGEGLPAPTGAYQTWEWKGIGQTPPPILYFEPTPATSGMNYGRDLTLCHP
jgi:hypothetical protein